MKSKNNKQLLNQGCTKKHKTVLYEFLRPIFTFYLKFIIIQKLLIKNIYLKKAVALLQVIINML